MLAPPRTADARALPPVSSSLESLSLLSLLSLASLSSASSATAAVSLPPFAPPAFLPPAFFAFAFDFAAGLFFVCCFFVFVFAPAAAFLPLPLAATALLFADLAALPPVFFAAALPLMSHASPSSSSLDELSGEAALVRELAAVLLRVLRITHGQSVRLARDVCGRLLPVPG